MQKPDVKTDTQKERHRLAKGINYVVKGAVEGAIGTLGLISKLHGAEFFEPVLGHNIYANIAEYGLAGYFLLDGSLKFLSGAIGVGSHIAIKRIDKKMERCNPYVIGQMISEYDDRIRQKNKEDEIRAR